MAEEGAASPPPWLATVGEDEGESAAARGDFGLPAELMAVLPDDPFAQLEVARKITSLALASRLGWLEAEAERLRAQLAERDSEAEDLRERVEQLDAALAVATGRLRRAEEEKVPLISFLPVEAAVLRAECYPCVEPLCSALHSRCKFLTLLHVLGCGRWICRRRC
jgi:hypothetical protein